MYDYTYIATAVLESDDVGMLCQLDDDVRREVDAGVGRHAVENDRRGAGVCHLRARDVMALGGDWCEQVERS